MLDDNHLLTMPNGERISFGANVNFLFETHELRWVMRSCCPCTDLNVRRKLRLVVRMLSPLTVAVDTLTRCLCPWSRVVLCRFASPATVSRMGMIFLSDEDVDVARIVKCWLVHQPADQQLTLGACLLCECSSCCILCCPPPPPPRHTSEARCTSLWVTVMCLPSHAAFTPSPLVPHSLCFRGVTSRCVLVCFGDTPGGWVEDLFYRALKWVLDAAATVVETTMVGIVLNALTHLQGASSKTAFVCGLIRGLGGNLVRACCAVWLCVNAFMVIGEGGGVHS